jgi:hypothetical protein
MNDTTLNLKLAMMDWFAAAFGCNNPHINGLPPQALSRLPALAITTLSVAGWRPAI